MIQVCSMSNSYLTSRWRHGHALLIEYVSINYPFSGIFLTNGVLRAYIRTTATFFFFKPLNIRSSCEYFRIFEGKAVVGNAWPHISACETCCLSGVEMSYSEASFETLRSATFFLNELKLLLNCCGSDCCHFLWTVKLQTKSIWKHLKHNV